MEKIIKSFIKTVKECKIPGEYRDLTVTINVYEETHRFLWWKWKTYSVKEYIPYIPNPDFSDHYITNDRLKMASIILRNQADIFIDEYKYNN
jgi:hypothetical protein